MDPTELEMFIPGMDRAMLNSLADDGDSRMHSVLVTTKGAHLASIAVVDKNSKFAVNANNMMVAAQRKRRPQES